VKQQHNIDLRIWGGEEKLLTKTPTAIKNVMLWEQYYILGGNIM
jgi:hypothetical protein